MCNHSIDLSPAMREIEKRAINAQSDRSLETAQLLARVLSDRDETTRVRATAAWHLGLIPAEFSEKILLENLTTDDENVRNEIVKSLGKTGTAAALDRLNEMPESWNDRQRKILAFAKLLIDFRSGQGHADRPLVSPASRPIRWTTRAARSIEGTEVHGKIKRLWGATYGVNLNRDTGFEIDFRGPKFIVLLNEEVKRGAFVDSVASRSMIAGLVVMEEPEMLRSTPRYLILTNPSERGVDVTLTRTSGDIVYAGEARTAGNDFRLTIRDVGPTNLPTEVHGQISNDRVALDVRVSLGSVRTKNHAQTITAA